ncbi:hypothetical protein DPX16_14630 [Anabarilius grahami]|uniref:Uncharacterized protein n=1 Tax=Anabarilius grahami TaxID=495550 RepID=A0A3N0YXR3_ANAGA|nr:hypothetical protein DPX16_14630 [Anabarilius grahami]
MPTGNEIEGEYLPSSDPAGDKEEMDMSMDAQDLEEETEKVNAYASSSADHNLRRSNRTLSALLSKHLKIMDLINWSLNAIDTIFSTRSLGSGEPDCPAGTFAAGYTMDTWERWRVVCLAALSVEDIEDIYLFGTMITGLLLIGLGFALVYRDNRKTVTAVQNLTRLPVMIEKAVGRAVSTGTGTINRNMDNIMEKLTALQRQLDRFGDQNGLRE